MTPKPLVAEIIQLIGNAKNAELCRDVNTLRSILEPVWNDYEQLPTFEDCDPAIRAELFRLCGFFLTFYGRSQNKTEYQSRAKDLLTNALEIFDRANLTVGAAEARIGLAFCYWNSGEVAEAVSIIDSIEAEFENSGHPVYLRAQINRLLFFVWDSNLIAARDLIEKIKVEAELCRDLRSRAMFHSEAAIVCRRLKDFKNAELNYREAIRLSKKTNNERFIAVNFNNMAMFYRDQKDYKLSHIYAGKSLEIYRKLGDKGWIPHVLDTIALIYLDEKNYAEALITVSNAIDIFYKGEDTNGLLDALWTKTKCFLAISETLEALATFGELQRIALLRTGEIAADKFSKLFADAIYVKKNLSLFDEVSEFKKSLVSEALVKTEGEVVKAANLLQLPKHQTLSQILKNQFPTLRDELGFNRRARRTVKTREEKVREDDSKTVILEKSEIKQESEIRKIVLSDKSYSFTFPFRSKTFEVYFFNKSEMKPFGVDSSAVVAVSPVKEVKEGMIVLVASGKDTFQIGKVEYYDDLGIHYICDSFGNPIPLDDENLMGEPAGFCLPSKAQESFIHFERLQTF